MVEGDWGEVISYLDRLICASEDDRWELKSWYWDEYQRDRCRLNDIKARIEDLDIMLEDSLDQNDTWLK